MTADSLFAEPAARDAGSVDAMGLPVKRGIKIFKVRPGEKIPAVSRWPEAATTNMESLYWLHEGRHNVGIRCGWQANGRCLVALDIDNKGNVKGDNSLLMLDMVHGEIPTTLTNLTPTGGRHLLFWADREVRNSASKIGSGLDVRGEGGYIVGGGSVVAAGAYKWENPAVPIAEAPEWLLDLMGAPKQKGPRPAAESGAGKVDSAVEGKVDIAPIVRAAKIYLLAEAPIAQERGKGNETTFKVAASVRDLGVSKEVCLDLMLDNWNERCEPPWAPDELADVVANAYKYAKGALGNSAPAEAQFDVVETPTPANDNADELETMFPSPPQRPALFKLWPREVELPVELPILVEGVLDQGGMSILYGDSNTGKTFVALDLCGHIATGRAWGGREVKQGLCVYIAAEAGRSAQPRVLALKQRLGADDFPLALVPCPVDLLDPKAHVQAVIELVKACEAETGLKCVIVVIDTLSRAFAGGNENASEDMGRFITNVDRIRAGLESAVMVVHHKGKNAAAGARGHSSLRAATDTELEVSCPEDPSENSECDRLIEHKKQRDMEAGKPIQFRLKTIELGADIRGRPIKSCMVTVAGDPAWDFVEAERRQQRVTMRTPEEMAAVAALEAALSDVKARTIGGERWTPLGLWVAYWATPEYDGGDLAPMASKSMGDARDKAFRRVRTALVESGDIRGAAGNLFGLVGWSAEGDG